MGIQSFGCWNSVKWYMGERDLVTLSYKDQTCHCNADIVMNGATQILGVNVHFHNASLNASKCSMLEVVFSKPHSKPDSRGKNVTF
jgi:hypothetical protein